MVISRRFPGSNSRSQYLLCPILYLSSVPYFDKTNKAILLILNSKQLKTTFYIVSKFEDNRIKITTVIVPER